ncbi:LamG domain-containing protein [Actinoplanes sp. NPDC051851]|uniref:LamG domain-containing protein n=1 Tax=Actinoplanes sp. NPDC051851 TaxID=3154753 RepID=UPI003447C92F
MGRTRWGIALAVVAAGLVALLLLPPSSATFTSTVTVPATIAASAGFPGVPRLISDKAPVFYHRMEEPQTATAGSAAADTMASSAGVYGPATNGPSLWWRFDETAGATSFSDVSGAAGTGSLTGTATAGGAGPMGGAVTLGNGSYLSSAGSPFRADRSFTMSSWFNVGSTVPSASRFGVLSMTGSATTSDAMIYAEQPSGCAGTCWGFAMGTGSGGFDHARGTSAVAANTWVHLAAVFDKTTTTMSLYVNGSLESSRAHTVPASASTGAGLTAGRYRDGSWLGTTGGTAQLGEVRTWRRALTAAEITQLTVRPTARYAFTETGSGTTYTTVASSTGAPGAVSRSAAISPAGGAALSTGREGNALTMADPSVSGWLTGPNAQLGTGSFTLSAWVRLTDGSADRTYFSANTGLGSVASFGYSASANRWVASVFTTVLTTVTMQGDVTTPVLNQWTHLIMVHDDFNNLLRMYVDGTAQTPVAFAYTPASGTSAVEISGRLNLNLLITDVWAGQIDDLRIYNGYPLNAASTTATTLQTFVALLNPGLSAEAPGGLQGSTKTGHSGSTAVAFGGTGNGYDDKYAVSAATGAFTVECLVRVGAGQSGVIAGLVNTGSTDRLLYVDAAGKLRFGVLQSGTAVTVVSAASVDDGAWHHVTASVGPITGSGTIAAGGLRLSLDGTVTSNNTVTTAAASTGVWRWGGAPVLPLNTWPSAPANPYLTGTLDELAVYDRQLTDQDDLWRVYANY